MPRKKSYPTVTDQFYGAGGSSLGTKAADVEVQLMLHWALLVEGRRSLVCTPSIKERDIPLQVEVESV